MARTPGACALPLVAILSVICSVHCLKPATPCVNTSTCHYHIAVVRTFTMTIQRADSRPSLLGSEVYVDDHGDLRTFYHGISGNEKLLPKEAESVITADGVFREVIAVLDLNDPNAYPTMPGPTIDVPKFSRVIVQVNQSNFWAESEACNETLLIYCPFKKKLHPASSRVLASCAYAALLFRSFGHRLWQSGRFLPLI